MKKSVVSRVSLLVGISCLLVSCAGTDITSVGLTAGGSDLFEQVKPVFIMPVSDIEGGNGIEAVFFDQQETEEGARIEITVVFYDEDHPSALVDGLYDVYRSFRYGRRRDVETFFFYFSLRGIEGCRFEFPGTYARDQILLERKVEHYSAEISASAFEYINSHPVIHVTTWNHLFRETATEPGLETRAVNDYPVYRGTRADVEEYISGRN